MAEKLDYTIQIDKQEYDVTAADSLHADLANQVEKALVVKKSVRKARDTIKNNAALIIKAENNANNLRDDIVVPTDIIGKVDSREGTNSFAYKGDIESTLDIVPSSGGVFTGPIYAPDIDAGDGFNINKFQVTNYNSVDTIIRELKGFPIYEWTGTHVLALTEGNPPTMLPFKVIIYTGSESDGWDNREKLRLINSMPDGTEPFCDTECKFFLINATNDSVDGGRILLGTYTPKENPASDHKFCTYVELRVKEANNVTHSIGNQSLGNIFEYTDKEGGEDGQFDAGIDEITPKVKHATLADTAEKLGNETVGSSTVPIYLNAGTATTCSEYAGGTLVKLNGQTMSAQTAEFYAPDSAGTDGYFLVSSGTGEPAWKDPNSLSVKHATEADSAAKVTTYIKNQRITDIFKAGTGTNISTVVKNAENADKADKADKLYIYSAGGTADGEGRATALTGKNDSYIIYSKLDPPSSSTISAAETAEGLPANSALLREGNIFIKLEP